MQQIRDFQRFYFCQNITDLRLADNKRAFLSQPRLNLKTVCDSKFDLIQFMFPKNVMILMQFVFTQLPLWQVSKIKKEKALVLQLDQMPEHFKKYFKKSLERDAHWNAEVRESLKEWSKIDYHFLSDIFRSIFRFDEYIFKRACHMIYKKDKNILALLFDTKKVQHEREKRDFEGECNAAYEDFLVETYLTESKIYLEEQEERMTYFELQEKLKKVKMDERLLRINLSATSYSLERKYLLRLLQASVLHSKQVFMSFAAFLPTNNRLLEHASDFPSGLSKAQQDRKAWRQSLSAGLLQK